MFNKFERVTELSERKELHCNECRRTTIHNLEARCVGSWETEEHFGFSVYGGTRFSLYRCGACDEVSYERSSWDSESYDHDENGQMYALRTEVQYPAPARAEFLFDTSHTPVALNSLVDEMLYAIAGGKLNLATVGLRIVVEFIVKDAKCVGRSLEKKIDDLKSKGLIDSPQLQLLHKLRKRGNAGAHDGSPMTAAEIAAGMGIVGLLLERLYNAPARQAEALAKAHQAFGNDEG